MTPTPFLKSIIAAMALGASVADAGAAQTVARNWNSSQGGPVGCFVIRAESGPLQNIEVSSTQAGWVIVIDAASCPANGVIGSPIWVSQPLGNPGAGQYGWSWNAPPTVNFQNGVTVLVSSTGPYAYTAELTGFVSGTWP